MKVLKNGGFFLLSKKKISFLQSPKTLYGSLYSATGSQSCFGYVSDGHTVLGVFIFAYDTTMVFFCFCYNFIYIADSCRSAIY